jgi:hypothetical protein
MAKTKRPKRETRPYKLNGRLSKAVSECLLDEANGENRTISDMVQQILSERYRK